MPGNGDDRVWGVLDHRDSLQDAVDYLLAGIADGSITGVVGFVTGEQDTQAFSAGHFDRASCVLGAHQLIHHLIADEDAANETG